MPALDFLLHRRSVPIRLLAAPGPEESVLQDLLAAALHVPDHGKLAPFRLLRIEGDGRLRLGEFLARLTSRLSFFHVNGCRLSDHGLNHPFADDCTEAEAVRFFHHTACINADLWY